MPYRFLVLLESTVLKMLQIQLHVLQAASAQEKCRRQCLALLARTVPQRPPLQSRASPEPIVLIWPRLLHRAPLDHFAQLQQMTP